MAAYTAKLLADLGADVVKVEPPQGDHARRLGPFPQGRVDPETSGLFVYLNANKRGIVLDLESSTDRARLARLLDRVDAARCTKWRRAKLAALGLRCRLGAARQAALGCDLDHALRADGATFYVSSIRPEPVERRRSRVSERRRPRYRRSAAAARLRLPGRVPDGVERRDRRARRPSMHARRAATASTSKCPRRSAW